MKKKFRGKGGKKKKKSSAGFKPVRLVLLVFLSVKVSRTSCPGGGGWRESFHFSPS